jgi:RNA polymerase sigma-70 factor (ECF subfamily)
MRSDEDFDAFYAATCGRVLGQLFAIIGSRAEAEDAIAEAYARAWQRWSVVSGYDDPEAWVRTVAYRISVSAWRKATARMRAHRRQPPTAELPGITPDHVALCAALRRIPAEQRRAIVLHYLVGRSVDEISRETNVPPNTVKSRLARGRRALAGMVSEFIDDRSGSSGREVRKHG